MTDQDDLARAASAAVDAWCAENAAPARPAEWVVEVNRFGPQLRPVEVSYTTVRDQALAIIAEDDALQQCVADLVTAGAGENEARAAVATVVEYALRKGIIHVQP